MRKLKLQVQLSLDGFVAGPNHEMDWITWNLDHAILQYISDLNKDIDCIVMGRVLAEGFIPHWQMEATDPTKKRDFVEKMSNSYDFALKMHETPKVVFSRSIHSATWENARLENSDLVKSIQQLKNQPGGDMIAYGGARFVSDLIKNNLIDDYYFFVNPAILGQGLPIFSGRETVQQLNLVSAQAFECGIVVQHYQPK